MGNCCGGGKDARDERPAPGAFQGEGQRLGTVGETTGFVSSPPPGGGISGFQDRRDGDDIPEPIHDPNLTDDQRAKQREARLAAAEARQKALGGGTTKKPKATNAAPLRGPNSQPLMKWSAG